MERDKLVCVRYSLIIFNITFVVFGLMIMFFTYFGLKVNESPLKALFDFNPDIKIIRKCFSVTGVLILMNAFFGLTAIFKKKFSFIIAFCFILIALFVFTLFAIIFGTISYANLNNQNITKTNEKFSQLITQFDWKDSTNETTKLVDQIQSQYQCCGALNGSESWEHFRPSEVPLGAYPLSCCNHEVRDHSSNQWCSEQDVKNRNWCPSVAVEKVVNIMGYLKIIIGVTTEAAIVQMFCIVCLFMLKSQPMDRNNTNEYLI